MTSLLRVDSQRESSVYRRGLRCISLSLVLLIGPLSAQAAQKIRIHNHDYALHDHPRVLFDGHGGERVGALRDPDGSGPRISPLADEKNPVFAALKKRLHDCQATATGCGSVSTAPLTLLAAFDWFMDHSQRESLAESMRGLERIEVQATGGYGFGCDLAAPSCGVGDLAQRAAADLAYYALAYTLVRDQLSETQRSTFAAKILNHVDKGYGDGCSNQLQPIADAVVDYDAGTTALRGSGIANLRTGTQVRVRGPGSGEAGWGTVRTLDSPSALTLTAPLRSADGSPIGSFNGAQISVLEPWNERTCGLVWMLQQLPDNGRGRATGFQQTKLAAAIDAEQDHLILASSEHLPTAYPYFLSIDGREAVQVTGVDADGLVVRRGQLSTVASAGRSGLPVYYSRTIPNIGTTDDARGAVLQILFGTAFIANALADDSAKAIPLLADSASDWLDRIVPKNKDMWSGFHQGGSSDDGAAGVVAQNVAMAAMLRQLRGEPTLDVSSGSWLKHAIGGYLYATLPDNPAAFIPWGDPNDAKSSSVFGHLWAPILRGLYGAGADPVPDWTFWQRNVSGRFQVKDLAQPEAERLLPFLLLYERPDDPRRDYRDAYPRQRAFHQVDGNPSRATAAWISRSGWRRPDDTVLFMAAFSNPWTQDHLGAGAPAAYKIYKQGWVLTENGPSDTGAGVDTNMVVLGDAANLTPSRLVTVIRIAGDDSSGAYAYVQVNCQAAYHVKASATRVLRSIVHLKKPGTRDYVFVYDSLETWKGIAKTIHLHFDREPGASEAMASTVLPNLAWIGPNRRLDTVVVLPEGQEVAARYEEAEHAHRVAVCASKDGSTCDTKNRKATFLMVHRPSSVTEEPMPAVRRLEEIDATYVGVQVEGPDPKVVLFPVEGAAQTSVSFRTTHAGKAQLFVTGMRVGTYEVQRNGKTVCAKLTATAKGEAIHCESESGAIRIVPAAAGTS